MKKSRILKERIQRVKVLFKELGYDLTDEQCSLDVFTCEIQTEKTFHGSLFIDGNNKFLEIAYSYTFSMQMHKFLKDNLEELMKICYEFGCYFNLIKSNKDLTFTVFSKEYFAGLNYYSLRDNLKDFNHCMHMISNIIDFGIHKNASKGG